VAVEVLDREANPVSSPVHPRNETAVVQPWQGERPIQGLSQLVSTDTICQLIERKRIVDAQQDDALDSLADVVIEETIGLGAPQILNPLWQFTRHGRHLRT